RHQQGHRQAELPGHGEDLSRRQGRQEHGPLRRAHARRDSAERHLSVHGDRRRGRHHRTRGVGLEGGGRAALLPHEPRPFRSRGDRDGRERLHRADREDASDGLRDRDEPAHHAADAGCHRLVTVATEPTARVPPDRTEVERLSRRRDEPDWLRDARLAALASLRPEDWPTGAEEEWRRFPLQGLPAGPLVVAEPPGPPSEYSAIPLEAAHKGVIFDRFADALKAHPELVRRSLTSSGTLKSHSAFRALNGAAFAHGSTFVYVPAGVAVELPLQVQKHWGAGSGAIVYRTIVVAEAGSSVTLLEEVTSAGGGKGRVAIPGLEVHAGDGAQVRYVGIQRFGDDVWDLGFQHYASQRDSTVRSFNVLVGSHKTKLGLDSDIRGDGAAVKLYGLVAAAADQR